MRPAAVGAGGGAGVWGPHAAIASPDGAGISRHAAHAYLLALFWLNSCRAPCAHAVSLGVSTAAALAARALCLLVSLLVRRSLFISSSSRLPPRFSACAACALLVPSHCLGHHRLHKSPCFSSRSLHLLSPRPTTFSTPADCCALRTCTSRPLSGCGYLLHLLGLPSLVSLQLVRDLLLVPRSFLFALLPVPSRCLVHRRLRKSPRFSRRPL